MGRRWTKLAAATLVLLSAPLPADDEIGFRLARKQLVIVPVLVDGRGPYEFLLDTGSTMSVVDLALASDLGLKPLQETVLRTASGIERISVARVERLDVGSRSTRTLLVLCSEMNGVRSLDENIRGILGYNFLSRFRHTVDYRRRKLRFEHDSAVEGTRVPFDASGRSIVVATGPLRLQLDTGATGVFLFRAEGLDIETDARAIARVSTSNGVGVGKPGWLRRLVIGDASFHRVPVTLMPQTGLAERVDGLIPGTLFDSIYFDYESGFVVLNPRRRPVP